MSTYPSNPWYWFCLGIFGISREPGRIHEWARRRVYAQENARWHRYHISSGRP